ncbi:Thiol:disulfide interchange protein DsbD precursor,thiol:disulfide interchange protein precursor,Uncharacterized protein predicted to be involved in C-type cytochrome biogenesis,Cytochrome C biogenesis protein transmembrane region [Chlamydia serpentis]|uniref:Thiol:disulfide interchange protein DsbD,thiol:disulfide interchange protein,Uncharacterized protein predicted to be involved in C-type cytochrome biogenesis,Cytochrome C biogenesis protein transme... n=1 Tax=Chlamydia serpentis TaxID=1967782 RepID=A0A2R8FBU3_9CHLA|nr:thioredoxin family protein [Chlamydia serpentis]SPN73900.1 Thiol:disulfide interchange protein DsbD precursor,thiol:disulfide interchange protein precursor,Uncharacterized protein predicted to be involved in C-type cytochrome biogenesis,Cytochrome C biogenesis protein transmembrane region [Chlamydia serpentis]
MNKFKQFLQTALIALFLSSPVLSGSLAFVHGEEVRQQLADPGAEFLSEGSYIPGQQTFRVGIKITASKGSHIYWKNPGEVGSPLKISWQLPENFVVEEEHWPTPKVFEEDGTTFFGYEDSALIVADIRPAPGLTPGQEVELRARVEWLACGDSCLPGDAGLRLTLPYQEKEPSLYPDRHAEFSKTLRAEPRVLEKDHSVQVATRKGDEIILNIPEKINAAKAWFVSEKSDKLFAYAESSYSEGKGTVWRLKVKNLPQFQKNEKLDGVLLLADHKGRPIESLTIHSEVLGEMGAVVSGFSQYLMILIMAFLGGLLLNIMPCVLPLVTLKVYGLIKSAGEHRSSVIANGLWFTLGVVGCFWGLAGIAVLLKILGHNIGWGFQLQEPMFVAVLVIVFFLFALSSLGLFEIGTMFANLGGKLQSSEIKNRENKAVGSFFNGVLATLVTTPCTGPFLGSVLGLVMSLSFISQLMIFSSIGLGMASPYLVFSVFPKMLSMLPKPGGWMSTFKQLTGFMLLATVTWLVWIFGSETSTTSVVVLLGGLWLAGLGAWILGRWGSPVSPKKQRLCASLLFFAFIGGAMSLSWVASRYFSEPQMSVIVDEEGVWQPFSLEKLAKLRAQGRPVFVNFTAKWCLTCQMNKPVLYGDGVQKIFQNHGIVTLEADWTRKDPGITEELARLGRASVPSYVYYPADNSSPVVLPEKITQNILEDVVLQFVR